MAQQILQAQIVLSGRLDASFGKMVSSIGGLGDKMLVMGSGINQISQPIIDAGKEITTMYAGFDDTMKYIQALGGLTEGQLKNIEKAARDAGATTRYTATQAAEALSFGAEAGLKYSENISLLGTTLNMAAAGNMDLQTSMDQLLTILYSTGTPLENASGLVDQLAAAASSSKTDIQSMGEAIARMGGISRYAKGGTQELFTMLAMMAQRGQEGAEAGTYLRNVILSLVAPTTKASEVMEELGASEEELSELADELDLGQAKKQMDELGLKTYDANGNLRPFMDILKDLDALAVNMTEQERNDVMSKLFPKRTLSAASNLLGELDVSMERINAEVEDSIGLAEKMAETRESGIGGALRLLKNAGQELELSFGKTITDKIMSVSETVRNTILTISQMPEASKGVIVDVAAVIAGMGPAAMLAGFGLKGIASILGFIASPVGAVMTGILALGVLAVNIKMLSEEHKYNAIKQRFGELEVDSDALTQRINALDGGLGNALTSLEKYGTATDTAGENYKKLVQTFSGDIQDAVIFGRDILPSEEDALKLLGSQMAEAVQSGIESKQMEMKGFVNLLFAGNPSGAASYLSTFDAYFGDMYRNAFNIGENIRALISKGLEGDDRQLDQNEWAAIKAEVERLNEVNAQIQDIMNAGELETILQRGMRLGADAYTQTLGELAAKRKDIEDRTYAEQNEAVGHYIAAARKEGKLTEVEIQRNAEDLRKRSQDLVLKNNENTVAAMTRLTEQMFTDAFPDFAQLGQDMLTNVIEGLSKDPKFDVAGYIEKYWSENAGKMGIDNADFQAFMETIVKPFQSAFGVTDMAAYEQYYTSNGIPMPDWLSQAKKWNEVFALISSTQGRDFTKEAFTSPVAKFFGSLFNDTTGNVYQGIQISDPVLQELMRQAGLQSGGTYNTAVNGTIGGNVPPTLIQNSGYGGLVNQMGDLGADAGKAFNNNLQTQLIDSYYYNGQGANQVAPVTDANGDPEVYFNNLPKFAEGGRAKDPSIFGDGADAEWAIPEAHTTRTAQLLDSARAASGFSWGEIIARTGGLNGDPDAGAYVGKIVYAPVIYAQNANGVEEKLKEDKLRFFDKMDEYLFEKSRREY